jgi:hypothetical protein
MRFTDERELWCSDVEDIAEKLANKDLHAVLDILEVNNVICLTSIDRPKTSALGRISSVPVFAVLMVASLIKWVVTGDRYLDSWIKRSKSIGSLIKWCGIK